jgi:hypothetical protein
MDQQGANVAMVDTGGPLAAAMATSPDWRVGFQDDQATVFARRDPR